MTNHQEHSIKVSKQAKKIKYEWSDCNIDRSQSSKQFISIGV